MDALEFLDRVFQRIPSTTPTQFRFEAWNHGGRPTAEGVGMLPVSGVDPEKLIARVMDVDHYIGNIDHVIASRSIQDSRFEGPEKVRFYQKINVPMLAKIHQELVLVDAGTRDGYRLAYWIMLDPETARLDSREAARSAYNVGAWFARDGVVAYALCSAPRKEDVGRLKFAALTRGADALASNVVKGNIECMVRWAQRS